MSEVNNDETTTATPPMRLMVGAQDLRGLVAAMANECRKPGDPWVEEHHVTIVAGEPSAALPLDTAHAIVEVPREEGQA